MNRWKASTPHGEQTVEATAFTITGNGDLVFMLSDLAVLALPRGAWTGCELVAVNDTIQANQWPIQMWIKNRANPPINPVDPEFGFSADNAPAIRDADGSLLPHEPPA
jgi:uncharacterized protein YvpB